MIEGGEAVAEHLTVGELIGEAAHPICAAKPVRAAHSVNASQVARRDMVLCKAPAGKSPTFVAAALKDPIGANLDRVQIVKGWLDKTGKLQERIYDVAVSGGRKIDADSRCKIPVGSTVNVDNATWTNTIGAPELIAVWKDPSFDPVERAFYYVRVLEIPTPRWTAYDAKRFGIKPLPGTMMSLQERAYTSPIWYTPTK